MVVTTFVLARATCKFHLAFLCSRLQSRWPGCACLHGFTWKYPDRDRHPVCHSEWQPPGPSSQPVMRLPYRILVLEDDEHTLEGIVELLREAGHNVTGREHVRRGQAAARRRPLRPADHRRQAARLQRPPHRDAEPCRLSRDGGHHHQRIRRAADGDRGQPVSRHVRAPSRSRRGSSSRPSARCSPRSGVNAAGRGSASSVASA